LAIHIEAIVPDVNRYAIRKGRGDAEYISRGIVKATKSKTIVKPVCLPWFNRMTAI
jgi:hypothetical protein